MTSDKVSTRISICSSLDGKVRLTTRSGATFDARVIRSEYVPTVHIVEPINFKIAFGEYTPELLRVLGAQISAADRAEGETPAPDPAKLLKALQWPTELAPKTTAAAQRRGEQALAELTAPELAVRQAIDSGATKGLAAVIARLDAPARERLRIHAAETGAAEALLISLLDDTADLAHLLVLAAAKGKLFCVAALLAAGADPNRAAKLLASDDVPRTALYQAVYNGHRVVVRRLIEAGARVTDSAGFTWPILRCPDAVTCRLLLAAGLDPDNRNSDGDPVLLSLGRNGHTEMVDALLAAGADPNATYPDGSTLLLHAVDLAAKTDSATSTSFIKNLLAAGADPNAGRLHGRNPLALALVVPHDASRSIARWLTDAGAIAVDDPAAPPLPTERPPGLPTWRARIDPTLARAPHYDALGVRFTPAANNTDSLAPAPSALPWSGLGSDIIAVARAKLEHLLGRPHDRGDNYKTTFEYRMLATHDDVTLAVHLADWKARELCISVAPHADATVRERITAALHELLNISPLAAFRDRFRFDDHAGRTYESDGSSATSQLPKLPA